jgi:hypothetical protein
MKHSLPIKKVSAELDVLRFPTTLDRPIKTHCLNCCVPLSLFQPDLDAADRLLGVCEHCKHWFLIHVMHDQTEGLLWRLPDFEVIRRLSFDDPLADSFQGSDEPRA